MVLCATVLWDIDKNTTRCLLKDLFSSDGRAVIAAGVTPAASAAIGLPRQLISPATLSDDAQKSKRRKTTVQLTSAENSSSSSSSDESNDEDEDLDSGSNNIIDLPADAEEIYNNSNLVLVNDTEWDFGKHVNIDQFKDHQYKPRFHLLNTNREILSLNEMDFWLIFSPIDDINHILVCSNAHLRDRRKPISRHEFFKSIGILYAMSINMLGVRRNYWSTETDGLFPAPLQNLHTAGRTRPAGRTVQTFAISALSPAGRTERCVQKYFRKVLPAGRGTLRHLAGHASRQLCSTWPLGACVKQIVNFSSV
ncbi:hypothetical protein J6590_103620 [Homalodisca vitripennis]|nr:hypothetical protein J6590_103620 [Homalodisca vitripennis]